MAPARCASSGCSLGRGARALLAGMRFLALLCPLQTLSDHGFLRPQRRPRPLTCRWRTRSWRSTNPSADSCEFFVQECLGLILTISHHFLYELWVAVQLRFGIQLPQHLDPLHLDDLVLGARKGPLGNPLVDLLYEVCFLIQRKVAGELITPIHYVWHRLGLGSPVLWVYLYHPYLVRLGVGKLAYGRVLREQAVPIQSPVCVHGLDQGWECGRSKDHLDVDPVSVAAASLEFATNDVSGANEEHRARRFYQPLDPPEVDMPFQHALQLIAGPRGSRRKVRTDRRRASDVAEEAIRLKKPIVEDPILK